jgi:YidC/Oxa1 family membrane protein insertase
MAGLLAFYYGLVHSYAWAIVLLTVTVMIFVSPLTVISTRNMLEMQALQPKIKELQKAFKNDRQGMAAAQQELFKEHKVSPASGCLPMLLQFPLLIVMYDVIRGLTNTVGPHHIASPKYIGHSTLLYKSLINSHGVMHSMGINLAVSATNHKGPFIDAIPYFLFVVVAIGLQFLQSWQITSKNPQAAKANQAAFAIQRYTPLIIGVIYIGIPSGVNLYFIVSGVFRVIQQELMWRHDPKLRAFSQKSRAAAAEAKNRPIATKSSEVEETWVSKVDEKKDQKGTRSNQNGRRGASRPPQARQQRPPSGSGRTSGGTQSSQRRRRPR